MVTSSLTGLSGFCDHSPRASTFFFFRLCKLSAFCTLGPAAVQSAVAFIVHLFAIYFWLGPAAVQSAVAFIVLGLFANFPRFCVWGPLQLNLPSPSTSSWFIYIQWGPLQLNLPSLSLRILGVPAPKHPGYPFFRIALGGFCVHTFLDWHCLWILWITALRMLPTLFFYLVCLLYCLHHSGLSAQKVETCTGDCPLQVVALQNGGNRTEPSRLGTQLDLANSEWTPQQRQQAPYSNSSPAQHSNGLHRITTMAMCAMQAACQGQTAILSQLWVVVGRCLRQRLSAIHPTASEGSKLDLEFLAGKSPKTSKNSSSETIEKHLYQSERQRRRKRQGQGEGEGKREGKGQKPRASLPLCQCSADGSAGTNALSHNAELGNIIHAYGGCSSWWYHIPAWCRTHSGHQEGLSGRIITPTGDQGGTRQNRSCCYQRPPQGDFCFGQSAEVAQRVGRSQRKASQSMAEPFERCVAVLATTDAILRGSTGGFQYCHRQGENGSEPISSVNPSLERESCRENTPRSSNSGVRWFGTPTGRRRFRRESSQKASASSTCTMCPESQRKAEHQGAPRNGGCPQWRRGRNASFGCKAIAIYLASQGGAASHGHYSRSQSECHQTVISGSTLSRLRSARYEPPQGRNVRFDVVEAYPIHDADDGAACNIQPYHCLFNANISLDRTTSSWHLTPNEAINRAAELQWICKREDVLNSLSDESLIYLRCDKPSHWKDHFASDIAFPCHPHVSDLWCGDLESDARDATSRSTSSHAPMRSRLLDERNSASVSADMTDPAHEEGQERHGDPEDEQLVIIDGWQDLLEILHQHTPLPDSIIHLEMYGLHITHHSIRLTDCEATIAAIREAVQESWCDAMPPRSVAYIHLVRPQEQRHARAVVLQLIVEIVPFGVDIPPNDVPILRRIRWHRDHSMTLETAYMRDHQTGYELLFDAHLDEWCHPRHGVQCNLHIETRIALMAHRHHLLPGSLLEIFIHNDDRPALSVASQQDDPQTGQQQSAIDHNDFLRARLADWTSPQVSLVMYGLFGSSLGTRSSTSQVGYQQVLSAVHHTWQDYVQSDTSVTLHIVRPQDDRQLDSLHLIVELTNPSQVRPTGYLPILQRISWHNIWHGDTTTAVYRVPGQNMREMLAACRLAEWCGPSTRAICRIQVERRSIPISELIDFQAGSLLEVLVSLQHVEDDGASLLQTGHPIPIDHETTTGHVGPDNVQAGSLSTHVYDRWWTHWALVTCKRFWQRRG